MPCWYFDKKELRRSPSIMQGMSVEDEIIHRREGARFILQIGNKMGLRYETMATGVVYFHRFYMVHSFQEFPRHVTACCCLFLAGKVEETPKKCKDIMKTARGLIDDSSWAEFGTDPREEVMTLERILLQTIKFDFIVEHPYSYLLKYAKCLKGDKKTLQLIVQMAWTFINDGLCTTLCLQWEPEVIAIALMYLAGKLNKFEVTDWQGKNSKQTKWWDMFVQGVSMELLDKVCHQVLDLYSLSSHKSDSSLSKVAALSQSENRSITQQSDSPIKKKISPSTSPQPALKKSKKDEKSLSSTQSDSNAPTTYQQYSAPTSYTSYPPQTYPTYPPPLTTTTANETSSRFSFPSYSSTVPVPSNTSMSHSNSSVPPHSHPPTPTSTPFPPSRYATPAPAEAASSIPAHYSSQSPSPISRYASQHPPSFSSTPHFPPPPQTHRLPHYQAGSYYPPTNTPSFLSSTRHTPNRSVPLSRPSLHREGGGGSYGSSQLTNSYQNVGPRPYYPPAS